MDKQKTSKVNPIGVITSFNPISFDPFSGSLSGTYNIKYMKRVAFSGSSGSGKTTLVTFIKDQLGIPHLSGSAGDLKTEDDKLILHEEHGYPGGGHSAVIKYSALNSEYGILNQKMLQERRHQLITGKHPMHKHEGSFVTDRSPVDNLVYYLLQVGYHPSVTDEMTEEHMQKCLDAWNELTHVIYVKAVQPKEVERNHRRVDNKYFQKSVDAVFEYWINTYFMKESIDGPEVMIIDYWDLELRKERVLEFLE